MTDTEKLNTTCKRLQLQCFRNYVLCNAVDEKLNNLDNERQKITDEIKELSAKLNDIDNAQRELINKINTLSQEVNTKIAKQQRRLVNTDITIIMMSLMRLACVIMFAWWIMRQH